MDIFDVIEQRKPVPAKPKASKRYQVSVSGKWSCRVYEFRKAKRMVSRAKRMGFDSYMSPLTVVV